MRASHLQGTVYPLATVTGWKGVLLCGSMFRPLALLLFLAVVDLGDTTASKEHARTRESHAPGVCQFCPGSLGDNSTIDRLCLSLEQTTSSDRCCMNRNGTVIGYVNLPVRNLLTCRCTCIGIIVCTCIGIIVSAFVKYTIRHGRWGMTGYSGYARGPE